MVVGTECVRQVRPTRCTFRAVKPAQQVLSPLFRPMRNNECTTSQWIQIRQCVDAIVIECKIPAFRRLWQVQSRCAGQSQKNSIHWSWMQNQMSELKMIQSQIRCLRRQMAMAKHWCSNMGTHHVISLHYPPMLVKPPEVLVLGLTAIIKA